MSNAAPSGTDFKVTDIVAGAWRVIKAKNPASARAFAARSVYTVEKATVQDGIDLAAAGGKIELASEAAQAPLQLDPQPDPPALQSE